MKLSLIALALFSAPLAAQQTYLDEDFTSGVFPPTGWDEIQTGVTSGWEQDTGAGAFHDDFYGLSESTLVTASMDLSAATDAQLHLTFGQRYATFRDLNRILITIDGGLSFIPIHTMTGLVSGGGQSLNLDLSGLLGAADVRLAFYYTGDYANEWWLERVVIDDQVAPPSNYWPNMPSAFLPVRSLDLDFDILGGTVPSWMALNNVDAQTRTTDAEAWCNIGNLAPCIDPYSGAFCLEMGLEATLPGPHVVANAMILGLDGLGFVGMNLRFQAKQFLEEWNPDDGIFLSKDGEIWYPVANNWNEITAGSFDWSEVVLDLAQTPVDINGKFYLAISQADNYPFGIDDGVMVDDVKIETTEPTLHYSISNLIAGKTASLDVVGAIRPGSAVSMFFSLAGPGPMSTPFGDAFMTPPLTDIGTFVPNANGEIHQTKWIPLGTVGTPVWSQVVEIVGPDGIWSNALAVTVQ